MKRNKLSACLGAALFTLNWCGQAVAQTEEWTNSYKSEAAGNYQQAAQQLEKLAASDELSQLRRSYLLYMQGRYPDAVKGYQRALEMNPQSFDAVLGLSLVLLAQGRWSDAAAQANWVLQNAPGNYVAQLRMLVAEQGQLKWNDVSKRAEELVRRYPTDPTMWVYVARSAAGLGNKNRAREAYQRVIQLVPGHIEALKYIGS